jgi:hypothetical protein
MAESNVTGSKAGIARGRTVENFDLEPSRKFFQPGVIGFASICG